MNWSALEKLGDLSIGLLALVIVLKLVLDHLAKMRVKRELGESKSPELMAAETLSEMRAMRTTFEAHDKADRAEFQRLLEVMEKSDDHLLREIRELRDEVRAARGDLSDVQTRLAVVEHRVATLEEGA